MAGGQGSALGSGSIPDAPLCEKKYNQLNSGNTLPFERRLSCFDPQALTSLTNEAIYKIMVGGQFRSTGSYEPDRAAPLAPPALRSFDPQALTSLTVLGPLFFIPLEVSIHRLLRA